MKCSRSWLTGIFFSSITKIIFVITFLPQSPRQHVSHRFAYICLRYYIDPVSASFCIILPAGIHTKKSWCKKVSGIDSNGWKSTGIFILNINQSPQSDWGTGGENFMFGINGILNKAIHHRNNKYTFDLYADVELGFLEATSFKKIRKTSDRIDVTAEIKHSIGKKGHYNYALLGNVNTQVFDAYNYYVGNYPKISSFYRRGNFL